MSPWTGCPQSPTSRRQMVSYTCVYIPMTSMRPSAAITTRCQLWKKLPTSFWTLTTSPSFDAHHGYWSIVLDQESSLLTTFNSPFGRYCFLHLPFGFVCSQDIFQKIQILEECQGCIGITDDITVHGHTEVEHNAHLQNLMWVAHKYGLVFNPPKTHVKAPNVNFFSCLYDANGVHPDPDKVDPIHALPEPTNITELQELSGIVMYLSPFIPGLSTLTAPLHELLKKDTNFTWNHTYDATFQHVKDAVISNTTLRYFNPSLPMTIQVDTSQVASVLHFFRTTNPLLSPAKPSLKLNDTMPT